MYYRAKHHKYRTNDMERAMKVFKKYLDNRKRKIRTKKLRKKK
jgi:hypothetical protein